MKNIMLLLWIVMTLLSCATSNKLYNPDALLPKDEKAVIDSIHLERLWTSHSPVLDIKGIDHYLVLLLGNKDTIFQVIDSSNDSIIAQFGQIGHARNEFLKFPEIVYCVRGNDSAPLLCVQEELCTKIIDLRKSITANQCIVVDVVKETNNSLFHHIYHLGDDQLFVYKTLSYEDPRDEIYEAPEFFIAGNGSNRWSIFPRVIKPQYTNIVDCAYYSDISISPDAKHLLCLQCFLDMMTIFDISNNKATGIINPKSYTLEFLESKITESNVQGELIWYNTSSCATDQHFLVIEDGGLYTKDRRADPSLVCGYDWDGHLRFTYMLDQRIAKIAYSEDNQMMYAVNFENELYRYKIDR